ncbi:unnamed protein product [Arctogadus glacialis]
MAVRVNPQGHREMTPTAGAPRSGSRRPPRCQRLLDCTVPYRSPGQRRGTGSALRSTSVLSQRYRLIRPPMWSPGGHQ